MAPKSLSGMPINDADLLAVNPKRRETEHQLAAHLQEDFLRSSSPAGLFGDLQTMCIAAEETCGDAIEVFGLDADHVAFFLVDATGHGLAASHLAALALQTIRSWMAAGCQDLLRSPSQVLTKLNELLCQTNSRDCFFIAATYVVYHKPTRTVQLARGGNPYPIVQSRACRTRQVMAEGPLLGILKDAQFENMVLALDPGDQLMIFSDGLEESGLPEELLPVPIHAVRPPVSKCPSSFLHAIRLDYATGSAHGIEPAREASRATRDSQGMGMQRANRQLAKLESEITRRAEAGQLRDDVSVVLLRIPMTSTDRGPDVEKADPAEQLALA